MKISSLFIMFFAASLLCPAAFSKVSWNYGSGAVSREPGIPDTIINNLPVRIEAFDLEIIPPSSGIQYFKDGIIFPGSSKSRSNMIPGHLSFGEFSSRYAVLKDSALEASSVFAPSLTFTYPCEAVTFNSDYSIMYFTKLSSKDGPEKIYQAKYSPGSGDQGEWVADENPLEFCSGQSTYTHPALSGDGKIMIFASDRTGSIGGLDLFVTLEKGGKWSEPVNLGNAVNSVSDELFPFLDSENNLYYSSDGIIGFGGYDIFVCKFKSKTWDKPVNLSSPVNSEYDDVAFTMSKKDGKSAFFTVKQKAGKRSMQLYKVTLNSNDENVVTLSQYFTNPAIAFIASIEPAVQATDKKTEAVTQRISGSDNIVYRVQFMTSFNPGTRSMVTVSGKDYNVFEYLYSGAYRLCVGEFSEITPAVELRNSLIQNDYTQATVIVFKNNVRSFDPGLLEIQNVPVPAATVEKQAAINPETKPGLPEKVAEGAKTDKLVTDTGKPGTGKTSVPEVKVKPAEPVKEIPNLQQSENKDNIIYRVQIITNNSSKGSYKIKINNKDYNTFEYLYSGAYRICVGDFSSLAPAKELQNLCRKYGYPQAFVVVFKNNVRSTDPALFK